MVWYQQTKKTPDLLYEKLQQMDKRDQCLLWCNKILWLNEHHVCLMHHESEIRMMLTTKRVVVQYKISHIYISLYTLNFVSMLPCLQQCYFLITITLVICVPDDIFVRYSISCLCLFLCLAYLVLSQWCI